MEFADLSRWTPVSLQINGTATSIDWGDLRGLRFTEPFFDQTIERWASGNPPPSLVRTELDALLALDNEPSLDPSALIFHLSRCGSTLLSRLLSTVPDTLVVSEPAPINTLLMADPPEVDEKVTIQILRLLVRALGRRRFGNERFYILKLSSWNVRRCRLFRQAFPDVPTIWVQRSPVEVMASVLASPPGWMDLQRFPRQAMSLFGIEPDEASGMNREAFCARALAAMLEAASTADDASLLVDYTELPEAVWCRVAPFLGMTLGESDIARMREESGYYSKDAARRPFTGDVREKRAVSDSIRSLAKEIAEPLYRELAHRRQAQRSTSEPV